MDNPLTPKKIQRLMYIASEDKSFNGHGGPKSLVTATSTQCSTQSVPNKSNQETSSGLIDLEQCSGFGESDKLSLSRSTSFHPAEMTGRSTGASEIPKSISAVPTFSEYGRFSMNMECIEKEMNKQTNDIQEIMRQSIASGYSFYSKRDLTADEASLVQREAPLPVSSSAINLKDSMLTEGQPDMTTDVDMSMGSYFQKRCDNFSNMMARSESPIYDVYSGTSVSGEPQPPSLDRQRRETQTLNIDLDCVPVRQPKPASTAEVHLTNHTFVKPHPISPAKENKPVITPLPKEKANIGMQKATHLLNYPGNQHLQRSLYSKEESLGSEDESLELSNLLGALGKLGSDSSVTIPKIMEMMRQLHGANQPLAELDMNAQQHAHAHSRPDTQVTQLKDTKKADTASSAATINTVINMHAFQAANQVTNEVPTVVITPHSKADLPEQEIAKPKNRMRSKSPSSKSQTTTSTVQENLASSFKSSQSPMQADKGEAKTSHVPSPNIQYKELDKSLDWQEILQPKGRLRSEGMAQVSDEWADIQTTPISGFVGVSTPATVAIRCLVENWLTFRIEFNHDLANLTIDLPRFPILLAPGRTEHCTIIITSNADTNMTVPFTVYLKDASINAEIQQEGELHLDFKMPEVQAISSDRVNRVVFPPIIEGKSVMRSFVLFSDCSEDLQLDLSVVAGNSLFAINSVQEIKKCDMSKRLREDASTEEKATGKPKTKGLSKQLCRLSNGNAIKVSITFTAPKLADINSTIATLNGSLSVHLIGVNVLLKKVEFVATVGTLSLKLPANKIHVGNVVTTVAVSNTGTIPGTWLVRFKDVATDKNCPFKMSANKLEVDAGATVHLKLTYNGLENAMAECYIIFEELYGGAKTLLEISGGLDTLQVFPLKTNCKSMSWVRPGRKELSLKNFTDKRLHIKCRIYGEGFYLDATRNPGVNPTMLLTFCANEQRTLVINFAPGSSSAPLMATLHLAYEKESNVSRKVFLYGCGGGVPLRWAGVVTHGDTALVPAVMRRAITLTLTNTTSSPAFVAASTHFNLQYMSVAPTSRLEGARRIVPGRGSARLTLHVDWALVEKKARDAAEGTALATVTVLTGGEITRRRILKVLREDANSEIPLAEHLKQLTGPYEGEDPALDQQLVNFNESKASLEELVSGIQEQIAQIELSDYHNQSTILIADDTLLEHHTLLTE